jgi:hypothetical protein
MNAVSPWFASAAAALADKTPEPLHTAGYPGIQYRLTLTKDSLWMIVKWGRACHTVFRLAWTAAPDMELVKFTELEDKLSIELRSASGHYHVNIAFNKTYGGFRYTTRFTASVDLSIPFWPRDILAEPGKIKVAKKGKIHVRQVGTRSGLLYFSFPKPAGGSVLYLQNLSALGDYCQQTKTSCKEVVGGEWPELGLALPAGKEPLRAGVAVTISDAIIIFDGITPVDEFSKAKQFMELLAAAYRQLPLPSTVYQDWPVILEKGLKDLKTNGCWSQFHGKAYLNAYVCDYATPPEIMVQLAILLPLIDYAEWKDEEPPEIPAIKELLPEFYNKELKTIMRWLPAAQDKLKGEEEQKQPMVMDSWYLHHPLLNLSRLALKGDRAAKQLFLDSLPFAIKVARHFKYNWPVFYHMETLEIIKEETKQGAGGEKDVAGIYAHVLLQAYELTGSHSYLREAEKAARTLKSKGFELLYQSNNTAFTAGALLRLYKLTGKKIYLDTSYLCLANIFQNLQLWDCHYGYGKNFPSFFALFPLRDAPYTAVYEEQETFCAFHDYLREADGIDILKPVSLLLAEYIRYLVHRAAYYYPPMLPKEMLSEEVKTGELDPKLWIAVEDLYDGWEKCGQVGQEVYGAGNAFGILPRHCFLVQNEPFRIFTDYPAGRLRHTKNNTVSLRIRGDAALSCRLLILKQEGKTLPRFVVRAGRSKKEINGRRTKDGNIEYIINGDQLINISWKK